MVAFLGVLWAISPNAVARRHAQRDPRNEATVQLRQPAMPKSRAVGVVGVYVFPAAPLLLSPNSATRKLSLSVMSVLIASIPALRVQHRYVPIFIFKLAEQLFFNLSYCSVADDCKAN